MGISSGAYELNYECTGGKSNIHIFIIE